MGLIYALDLARARDAELSHTSSTTQTKSSCTSLPQQWQKPRGNKIRAVPISSVVVVKANENRMRRPIDCRVSTKRANVTFQIVLLVIYLHCFKGKFRVRVSVDG